MNLPNQLKHIADRLIKINRELNAIKTQSTNDALIKQYELRCRQEELLSVLHAYPQNDQESTHKYMDLNY